MMQEQHHQSMSASHQVSTSSSVKKHNQGVEKRQAERDSNFVDRLHAQKKAERRRAYAVSESRQNRQGWENVIAGERWQATRRDNSTRPEDELTSYLWEKDKKEKDQKKQSADKRRREESSSSSATSSPTKPPASQRRREGPATASANVPAITNNDLINHMSQTGLLYTNPFIREKVEQYILAKLGMEEYELSEQHKKELDSFSKAFYGAFLKKRTQVARKISQIQLSSWGQNQITISKSFLGTPEAPVTPTAKSTAAVQPKFSHSELTDVMAENSFSFTDTANQVKAVRDHILSRLALTVEDLDDCLYES